tara:strand:+ start:109 stop:324 length:216 start_codon:yes stop_codon:yes gene_type:complete
MERRTPNDRLRGWCSSQLPSIKSLGTLVDGPERRLMTHLNVQKEEYINATTAKLARSEMIASAARTGFADM